VVGSSISRVDGIELAKQIKDIDKDIKLILMSAYDQTDISPPLMHEFLQKPIHIEKLRETVFCTAIAN
jgi:two-component SAPR family response regulator